MRGTLFLVVSLLAVSPCAEGLDADVQTISHGERVDVAAHCVSGKLTLIDFYADWCAPCRALAPTLERLAAQYPDRLAVRIVDISQSGAPAGVQYGVNAIPYLMLFDESGAKLREGPAGPVLGVLERRLAGSTSETGGRGGGGPLVPVLLVVALALGVAAFVLKGRSRPPESLPGAALDQQAPSSPAASGGIWFAMIQNSLEGPFTEEELQQMRDSGVLHSDARIRRRGDASWARLDDIVG